MEFIYDNVAKTGQKSLEQVALVVALVLEHEGVIKNVWVDDKDEVLPLDFAGEKLAVVADEADEGFPFTHLLVAVVTFKGDFVALFLDGNGRDGDDFEGQAMGGDEGVDIGRVLGDEGVGGGDEENVLPLLQGEKM